MNHIVELWKLLDEYNVRQATLLILGEDPTGYEKIEDWGIEDQPSGYTAISSALRNAVRTKAIKSTVFTRPKEVGRDELWEPVYDGETEDWEKTVIPASEIRKWLVERNYYDGFFLEKKDQGFEDFQDSTSPFYAPKLAAAISAWRALKADPSLLSGKTPKQALEKYLRENASKFDLTKDDGIPNERGIREISKVANWNQEGGVAKTVTQVQKNPVKQINLVKTTGSSGEKAARTRL